MRAFSSRYSTVLSLPMDSINVSTTKGEGGGGGGTAVADEEEE